MPWTDFFHVPDERHAMMKSREPETRALLQPAEILQAQDLRSIVVAVLPEEIRDHHLAILGKGMERLRREHPDTACRIYLKESSGHHVPELLKSGCEILLFKGPTVSLELLPFLALGENHDGGTTFTLIDRFWFAADDVSRTKLLGDGSPASWRVLDTWSRSPEEYSAILDSGWGTRMRVDVEPLFLSYFDLERPADQRVNPGLRRDFVTGLLYPRLAVGGFLSIYNEVSPAARHWVALDIEHATRLNSASEIHYITALEDEDDLQELPTIIYKGYEMPVAGVVSSHQRLSIFSPELEKLHASMRETLRDFHSFAEEMNIRYSLWAGSLLGLFTCGDFLPWDDDMDILVHPADFDRLEKFWWSCPHAPSGHIPYHRSYVKDLTRLARFGGKDYEFLSSGPGQSRILYKLRPLDSEGIFAYNIGGVDLTSIYCDNGRWLERWKLHQPVPSAAALENDVEDVLFGGVATKAYRRDLIEPYLLEKYEPLEWWKHPLLSKKPDLPEDEIGSPPLLLTSLDSPRVPA